MTTQPRPAPDRGDRRRVIATTCQTHGAAGFTDLLVTKENGVIVLNQHIANCCVLRLDEQAATALHGILGKWLGEYGPYSSYAQGMVVATHGSAEQHELSQGGVPAP